MNAALVFSSAFEISARERPNPFKKIGRFAKLAHPESLTYIPAIGIQAPSSRAPCRTKEP
ncbi:hypothetical protein [Mesorhizobium sp.]|uniref:hypothetical protein n=1 Tax=Mesorhizobium sp. TaxID=1871066 RepID=UPI000FEA5A68|nr:hypothetical protein [Mesorhizobium sp.]RWK42400.1 MAG: hypothetical protein EOR46_11210 [Mesorhizobium sp.]RWK69443.1 MAG: hypothetical protein EOR54_08800 [Mesorhizobium sp.]RWK79619.1 MAG: hypothetical protein EOR50_05675 [Mesorhizobium sp.]RWK82393.1 MAG: hypothetical protein EOR51_11945 [Mesorhizobium sp.]RWL08787.1 MAG: hypothetical protein EOR55_03605 [Mesorhizobium sp.]